MKRLSLAFRALLFGALASLLCQCSSTSSVALPDKGTGVLVSVRDQKLALISKGEVKKVYPVSTSKFGIGNRSGSNKTPIGRMEVVQKIGAQAPAGTVFKSRRPTGEVLRPNAPGRDPIVTRIIRLRGTEWRTRSTFDRCIYIHGTPEERRIGSPASYGCIRMKSRDIIDLFNRLDNGSIVRVTTAPLPRPGRSQLPKPVIRQPEPTPGKPRTDEAPDAPEPLPEVTRKPSRYARN